MRKKLMLVSCSWFLSFNSYKIIFLFKWFGFSDKFSFSRKCHRNPKQSLSFCLGIFYRSYRRTRSFVNELYFIFTLCKKNTTNMTLTKVIVSCRKIFRYSITQLVSVYELVLLWCYSRMCWGPEPGFWAEGSHSLGCSVHRSHRQLEGWRQSAAAGCLPVEENTNT